MDQLTIIGSSSSESSTTGKTVYNLQYASPAGVGVRILSGITDSIDESNVADYVASLKGSKIEGEIARKRVKGFETGMKLIPAKGDQPAKLIETDKKSEFSTFDSRTIVRLGSESWDEAARACGHELAADPSNVEAKQIVDVTPSTNNQVEVDA